MTALSPTGLLPDSTTLESLYDEGRLTVRAWNRLRDHNHRATWGQTQYPALLTVGDIRELGTDLRRVLRDVVAERNILAAIRTDWQPSHPDLSPGYAADAEPVADFVVGVPSKAQRLAVATQDDAERLRAEYAVRGQQLDEALHRIEGMRAELEELRRALECNSCGRDEGRHSPGCVADPAALPGLRAALAAVEAKLAALTQAAGDVVHHEALRWMVPDYAALRYLRHLLDQQAGDGGGR